MLTQCNLRNHVLGKQAIHILWAIALEEDSRSIAMFDIQWKYLVDFVDKAYNDRNSTQGEVNCCSVFLDSLYNKKHQWVRRFIVELKRFIGHVKTTQRVESLNRIIAEDTSPSNGLVKTFDCMYEREKLRFLEARATLISAVMSTSSISTAIVHPLFQELIANTSKFILKKLIDEISKSNLYVIEARPLLNCAGIFVIKRYQWQEQSDCQLDINAGVNEYRRQFSFECRQVISKIDEIGLVSLTCTCMLLETRGYPCRHVLFVYATECATLATKETYIPIASYLHAYWQIANVLSNFEINLEVSMSAQQQPPPLTQVSILGLTNNVADNMKRLEAHELKVHEFKVCLICSRQ